MKVAIGLKSVRRWVTLLIAAVAPGSTLWAQHSYVTPYAFTALTGTAPSRGAADGPAAVARFDNPAGVAIDVAGTVYVADENNHTVRKITSSGVVTTLAGLAHNPGSSDGIGNAARFYFPTSVAVDLAGNVYVADGGNFTIRKITSSGVVTTLAGTAGSSGANDGTGAAARFGSPQGLAVDASANVYVADSSTNTIRKITPAGVVTTLAGTAGTKGSADGTGVAARFNSPYGVTLDGVGNLYVADTGNHTVRKITSGGVVTTLAGTAGSSGANDGTGSNARFNFPGGVIADLAGNVYVADGPNNTIRKIASSGVVTTLAGTAGTRGSSDGTGGGAGFNAPHQLAADASGNVYLADSGNNTIRRVTGGGVVTTLAGSADNGGFTDGALAVARFNGPYGVAVDGASNVYVADTGNNTIRKINTGGVATTLAGLAGSSGSSDGTGVTARFNRPQGIAVDSAGNVYVADTNNSTIRKITSSGVVTTLAGTAGSTGFVNGTGSAARFKNPYGVAVDSAGNVYVADTFNSSIRKITSDGVVTTLAGFGNLGLTDGTGSAAGFSQPQGLAVDGSGNVYVADTWNNTIRKVTPAGVVTTLAGSGSLASVDGMGRAAAFLGAYGVAVDSAGNLFITDTQYRDSSYNYTNVIRKMSPDGVVTTIAGSDTGFADGLGSAALFYNPFGIAVDNAGTIYVADTGNSMIRRGTAIPLTATISNLSVRTNLANAQTLTVGFVTSGAKSLMLRAVGPSLNTVFGLTGFHPDPKITVLNGQGATLAQNDDWSSSLSATFASLGAFPLSPASKDAGLQLSITGPSTAQVNGPGSGIVLVEVYDSDVAGATGRLTNVSARNQVGGGANVLVSGFVIGGIGARTLLIRGIGPALKDIFGVNGALADPVLEIHQTINGVDTVIASNDNWDPSLTATFDKVGAYRFTTGSKDAALLITLQPGIYTAQVAGVNSGTGDGVVEVYEVP